MVGNSITSAPRPISFAQQVAGLIPRARDHDPYARERRSAMSGAVITASRISSAARVQQFARQARAPSLIGVGRAPAASRGGRSGCRPACQQSPTSRSSPPVDRGVRADGHLAAAAECGRAPRARRPPRRASSHDRACAQASAALAFVARLDGERALAHRRAHHVVGQELRDAVLPAQPLQPGRGQHDARRTGPSSSLRRRVSRLPRTDSIVEVRPQRAQLRDAAQRTRADLRALRQVAQAAARPARRADPRAPESPRAAGPRAARSAGPSGCGPPDRCAPSSSASSISFVNRPLRADLGQRHVGDLVAGGLDDLDAAGLAQLFQPRLHPVRLPESELRAARSDGQHF